MCRCNPMHRYAPQIAAQSVQSPVALQQVLLIFMLLNPAHPQLLACMPILR